MSSTPNSESAQQNGPVERPGNRRCLILFTKPASAGRVKTRLIGALSAEQAAELHGAFLADVGERLCRGGFDLQLAWALDDDQAVPEEPFAGAAELEQVVQRGSDLGARLYAALAAASERYELVGVVGSDHPELELSTAERAFKLLEGDGATGADVAIGPAADGGYYLLALRREALHQELFTDIAWSSETVLETTLERCARLRLSVEQMVVGDDVDRPEDLRRLATRLRESRAPSCPRTRRLLAAWGWLENPVRQTSAEAGR